MKSEGPEKEGVQSFTSNLRKRLTDSREASPDCPDCARY